MLYDPKEAQDKLLVFSLFCEQKINYYNSG